GETEQQIAVSQGLSRDGIKSRIVRFRDFFPELTAFIDDLEPGRALAIVGRTYLEEFDRQEQLEAKLREPRATLEEKLQRFLRDGLSVAGSLASELGPIRASEYIRGRVYGLRMNHRRSERHLARAAGVKRPRHLRGVILNDLGAAQAMLGDLSSSVS